MKIPNLVEIAVAFKRAANPTPEQKELADERISTCDPCDQRVFSDLIMTYKCNACGCVLMKKVYSPKGAEACPLGKWKN